MDDLLGAPAEAGYVHRETHRMPNDDNGAGAAVGHRKPSGGHAGGPSRAPRGGIASSPWEGHSGASGLGGPGTSTWAQRPRQVRRGPGRRGGPSDPGDGRPGWPGTAGPAPMTEVGRPWIVGLMLAGGGAPGSVWRGAGGQELPGRGRSPTTMRRVRTVARRLQPPGDPSALEGGVAAGTWGLAARARNPPWSQCPSNSGDRLGGRPRRRLRGGSGEGDVPAPRMGTVVSSSKPGTWAGAAGTPTSPLAYWGQGPVAGIPVRFVDRRPPRPGRGTGRTLGWRWNRGQHPELAGAEHPGWERSRLRPRPTPSRQKRLRTGLGRVCAEGRSSGGLAPSSGGALLWGPATSGPFDVDGYDPEAHREVLRRRPVGKPPERTWRPRPGTGGVPGRRTARTPSGGGETGGLREATSSKRGDFLAAPWSPWTSPMQKPIAPSSWEKATAAASGGSSPVSGGEEPSGSGPRGAPSGPRPVRHRWIATRKPGFPHLVHQQPTCGSADYLQTWTPSRWGSSDSRWSRGVGKGIDRADRPPWPTPRSPNS